MNGDFAHGGHRKAGQRGHCRRGWSGEWQRHWSAMRTLRCCGRATSWRTRAQSFNRI